MEGLVEGLDDSPPDFHPPKPPALSRGLSLPNILDDSIYEDETKTSFITDANESMSSLELLETPQSKRLTENGHFVSKINWTVEKQSVAVQVSADFTQLNKEIAEQSTSCQTDNEELNYCVHKAVNTAENITSTSTFKKEPKKEPVETKSVNDVDGNDKQSDSSIEELLDYEKKGLKLELAHEETLKETWSSAKALPEVPKVPVSIDKKSLCNGAAIDKPCGDFRVNVEILQHEFGPLPPSPVEEVEDEYSDILQSVPTNRKSDSLSNDCSYRRNSRLSVSGSVRSNRAVPEIPPHKDHNSSLKTRSVDAGFTRNHRMQFVSSRKDVSCVSIGSSGFKSRRKNIFVLELYRSSTLKFQYFENYIPAILRQRISGLPAAGIARYFETFSPEADLEILRLGPG